MLTAPTGTVTLLFTDIQGSTQLLRRLGDRYPGILAEHHTILRATLAKHGGYEVSTDGDAFLLPLAARPMALLRPRARNGNSRNTAGRKTSRCRSEWRCTRANPVAREKITLAWTFTGLPGSATPREPTQSPSSPFASSILCPWSAVKQMRRSPQQISVVGRTAEVVIASPDFRVGPNYDMEPLAPK